MRFLGPRIRTVAFLLAAAPVLWPVTELFAVELARGSSWREVFGDVAASRLPGLFLSSCLIALIAALIASAAAVAQFAAFQAAPKAIRPVCLTLAVVPLFIPTHLLGLAWIQAIGRAGWITTRLGESELPFAWLPEALYSPVGCAVILASHFYPLVLGALMLGWRSCDAALVESQRLYLSPGVLWSQALAGWLRPWVAAGFASVFALSMTDYIVPFLLGRRVFSVEVLTSFNLDYLPGKAAVLSLPMLLISAAGFALARRALRRVDWTLSRRNTAELPLPGVCARGAILAAGVLPSLLGTLLPLGTFFVWAGAIGNYSKIWESSEGQIHSSLVWTLTATAAATTLALLAPHARAIIAVAIPLMLALPGSILGVAHIRFWNRPSPGDILGRVYDSGLILPLGLVGVVLPIAILLVASRRRQTPQALEDLGRVSGARFSFRANLATRAIFVLPSVITTLWIGFVLAMQESHASALLVAPGQETLAIRTTTLLHFAPDSLLAALCLIALGLMLAISAAMLILGRLVLTLGTNHGSRILLN